MVHGDTVRIIYIHPAAAVPAYASVAVLGLGSVLVLWKKSRFWDLMAGAAAEIGILFTVLTLATGMLWGKPAWGTYWEWDPRPDFDGAAAGAAVRLCGGSQHH